MKNKLLIRSIFYALLAIIWTVRTVYGIRDYIRVGSDMLDYVLINFFCTACWLGLFMMSLKKYVTEKLKELEKQDEQSKDYSHQE